MADKKRPIWGFLLWDKKLPRKPEVTRLMVATGMSRGDVVLALMEFWGWVDDHFPTGRICPADVPLLSQSCPGVCPEFFHALLSVGWLAPCSGGYEIPHFETWLGYTAKARLQEAMRKWVNRQKLTQCPAHVPDSAGQEPDIPGTCPPKEKDTEVEKKNPPSSPPKGGKAAFDPLAVAVPTELDTAAFRAAWSDWVTYRKQRRPGLTEIGADRQIKKLAALGPEKAVAAIEQSITHGWQGLFAPEEAGPSGRQPRQSETFEERFDRIAGRLECSEKSTAVGRNGTPPSSASPPRPT